ncbi:MAG: hypothetical protein ABIJ92_03985 [Candidatus Aenigmatarchaeota archaeon]
MKHLKAQAAMEYLMTYGWAILIVVIVAAALFALGLFNPGTFTQSTSTGFQGFNIQAGGWQMNSTQVTFILTNGVGANINITGIQATYGGINYPYAEVAGWNITTTGTNGPRAMNINQEQKISMPQISGPAAGSSYTVDIRITYDNLDTGLTGFTSSGTLTGTAS